MSSHEIAFDRGRPRFLRLKEVAATLGVHKATIWRWIQAGQFPQPVRPVPRTAYWLESDLDDWNRRLLEERRSCSESKQGFGAARGPKNRSSHTRRANGSTRKAAGR